MRNKDFGVHFLRNFAIGFSEIGMMPQLVYYLKFMLDLFVQVLFKGENIAYRWHITQLEQFHTRTLRTKMGIRWQDRVRNQEVLDSGGSTNIESMLLKV